MSLTYDSLDDAVRQQMLAELDYDVHNRRLYISPRLNDTGQDQWESILRDAITSHDDAWIENKLRSQDLLQTHEERQRRNGGIIPAKIPVTAAETLAEGEFNRFYIRGLCRDVIANGQAEVEVYRGKQVNNPRPESERKIGQRVEARPLLDDLRAHPGVDTALGLPSGPNSGLTVRRI